MPKKYDAEPSKYWLDRDEQPYSQLLPHPFTYLVRRFRSEARLGWPLAAITAAT